MLWSLALNMEPIFLRLRQELYQFIEVEGNCIIVVSAHSEMYEWFPALLMSSFELNKIVLHTFGL